MLCRLSHELDLLFWKQVRLMRADRVYMDFSKAFDKVGHDQLLWNVKSYAIQAELANWIQN